MKTSWRRLENVFRLRLQKTSWRHLGQDEYVRLGLTSSEDVFKIYSSWLYVFKTSSRRLQNVFKTSWKTSSRHLQDFLQRCLQDVFKTYYQVKLFLLTRLWEAFNTFLRLSFPKTVIYSRGICLRNTTSDKFMVSVQNLQEIKISQVLVFHFSTPFHGCLERCIYNLVEHLRHNGAFLRKYLTS